MKRMFFIVLHFCDTFCMICDTNVIPNGCDTMVGITEVNIMRMVTRKAYPTLMV